MSEVDQKLKRKSTWSEAEHNAKRELILQKAEEAKKRLAAHQAAATKKPYKEDLEDPRRSNRSTSYEQIEDCKCLAGARACALAPCSPL